MIVASIIIPTLNEAEQIGTCLTRLQALRDAGFEIIVVDGGSTDATPQIIQGLADHYLSSEAGRATQMNIGACQAQGSRLFFLHVDTQLPKNFLQLMPTIAADPCVWGRFDLQLSGQHRAFRIIETAINIRSRLTGIATGDQVIFMTQQAYQQVQGFPAIALMEDIAISKKLRKIGWPLCYRQKVISSSRRWERHGIVQTVIKMWCLRLAYFVGADPAWLAKQYG